MSEEKKKFSDFMADAGFTTSLDRKKIVSVTQLEPGSMYNFSYKGRSFIICITSTQKTRTGFYRAANTKNLLVTGFKLHDVDSVAEGMKLLVKNLFFRKKAAKYKGIVSKNPITRRIISKLGNDVPGDRIAPSKTRALISVAGIDSFRTFIFSYMKNIRKYTVEEAEVDTLSQE